MPRVLGVCAGQEVLVVDDEPHIREVLRGYLAAEGFEVVEAGDGAAALRAARDQRPDLVLLDMMLPGLDGLEVLRRLRASDVYVILVTAWTEEVDKLVGLRVGADDYITKPFSPREVAARVKAVLRRPRDRSAGPADPLRFAGLAVDRGGRDVYRDGTPVPLSMTLEFDLLVALAEAPGRVFSRRQLIEHVWGADYYGDEHLVDVHIRNLRRKLGDDATAPRYVRTVRSTGYRIGTGQQDR